ncbi:MAG: hypothetical protein LQ340_008022, partial [Diploschistes diacapsis]
LKNTTDDALPNFLNSLRFGQSHVFTDVRLILGYSAVAIAAATFYIDYKYGWEDTKVLTCWAVLAYFILNSALTLWIWGIEKRTIYRGSKDDVVISLASTVNKHSPIYMLKVQHIKKTADHGTLWVKEIEAPFTKWFTADGQFVPKPFQRWLLDEIPVIGKD